MIIVKNHRRRQWFPTRGSGQRHTIPKTIGHSLHYASSESLKSVWGTHLTLTLYIPIWFLWIKRTMVSESLITFAISLTLTWYQRDTLAKFHPDKIFENLSGQETARLKIRKSSKPTLRPGLIQRMFWYLFDRDISGNIYFGHLERNQSVIAFSWLNSMKHFQIICLFL